MLIALTGLKQGVDSTRVCSGKEMEEHHIADALQRLVDFGAVREAFVEGRD